MSATATRHTPGPWKTGDADWRTIVGAVTRFRSRGLAAVATIDVSDNEAEDLANARLIAAAPDLLAACEVARAECAILLPYLANPYAKSMRDLVDLLTKYITAAKGGAA